MKFVSPWKQDIEFSVNLTCSPVARNYISSQWKQKVWIFHIYKNLIMLIKLEADLQRIMNIRKYENEICHKAPTFTSFCYLWTESQSEKSITRLQKPQTDTVEFVSTLPLHLWSNLSVKKGKVIFWLNNILLTLFLHFKTYCLYLRFILEKTSISQLYHSTLQFHTKYNKRALTF